MLTKLALALTLFAAAEPAVAQTSARTNAAGPTVSQIHAAIPQLQASGRAYPTPVQSVGPFPFWFTVEPNIAAGFVDCSPDGRCDRWIMFSVVEPLTETQMQTVSERFYVPPSPCIAIFPGVYEIRYARINEINPQAPSLVMLTPNIDNNSSPEVIAAQLGAFRNCASVLREIVAAAKATS